MAEPVPSERELEILKVLWELGESSVRQVRARMYPRGEQAFNTVQTQLRIMQKKGLVTHRAEGRTFFYSPVYTREQAGSRFLNRVFDGALDEFVLTLIRAGDVRPEELDRIERLIADARSKKRSRKSPKQRED
ncbi:MAG: BlaI/MecI/CopY family transcriptional regulator [Planctomycetaceae bacterium]